MHRYDRFGDVVEDTDEDQPEVHDPRCDGKGWCGYNAAGQIIACPTCRPHVYARKEPADARR
jgi:hypothetical protein